MKQLLSLFFVALFSLHNADAQKPKYIPFKWVHDTISGRPVQYLKLVDTKTCSIGLVQLHYKTE